MNTDDDIIKLIEDITLRPGMYVYERTDSSVYKCVTAFLHGCDYALNGSLFEGFNEWLCMKYNKSYNVHWDVIIAFEKLGDKTYSKKSWPKGTDEILLGELREIATEFLRHRCQVGLRNVLYDHGKWMRRKRWFNENVERYGSSEGPKSKAEQSQGALAAEQVATPGIAGELTSTEDQDV